MKKLTFHLCTIFCLMLLVTNIRIGKSSDQPLEFEWESFLTDGTYGISWSPNSQQLAFSNRYGTQIWVFNLQTKTVEKKIDLPELKKFCCQASASWSPDGSTIAVARQDIYMLDALSGEIVETYPSDSFSASGQQVYIQDVKWSDDSLRFFALDSSGYIYIVDFETGKTVTTVDLGDHGEIAYYPAFDWSSDNTLFAAPLYGSNTIGFWKEDGGLSPEYIRKDRNYGLETDCVPAIDSLQDLHSINWSRDSKNLAIGADYGLTICHFEGDFTIKTQTIDNGVTTSAIWSLDNHWLISTSEHDPACWIKIFDATEDFELVQMLEGMICGIGSMIWSPDGQYLAIGNGGKLWIGTVK